MSVGPPRIACVGDVPLGSRRAHAINVLKTSGGFARAGWEVLLLCREPQGDARDIGSILASYGEPGLAVECIPSPDERTHPPGSDKRGEPFAAWAAERATAFGAATMYARHPHASVAWADAGGVSIAETHAYVGESKPGFVRLLEATARRDRPVAALATISCRLREHYASRGARAERIHVIPDGVDLGLFTPSPDHIPARDHATSPEPGLARIVYAGHLYDWKGVPTILGAAAQMPEAEFHIYGGMPEDAARVRARAASSGLGNVRVHGWIEHAALPARLWEADVLLLPPGMGDPSRDWTSPVKLGEYLATGRPIVASAIPALRDWVDEPVVRWFEPDDAASLAAAIRGVLRGPDDPGRGREALALARRWSYPARAAAMLRAAGLLPGEGMPRSEPAWSSACGRGRSEPRERHASLR